MKFFVFLSSLFAIAGCANKAEEVNYSSHKSVYVILGDHVYEIPPPPPRVYVPSAPSSSIIIPAQPNFVPIMPEESRKRLEMLLTNKK